jgi:hypothetical protein
VRCVTKSVLWKPAISSGAANLTGIGSWGVQTGSPLADHFGSCGKMVTLN